MADLKLSLIEERPGRLQSVLTWLPQAAVALFFLSIGLEKFSPTGMWVHLFERIGFGQWFRYLTGVLQVGGALLMLLPRMGWIGAVILACTMAGAVVVQLAVLHSAAAIVPAVLLGVLVAFALWLWSKRHD